MAAYTYLVLPWTRVAPVFNRLAAYTVYGALEANFVGRRAPADVLRLVDGTTAYRMKPQYLYKFKSDLLGWYVDLLSFGVHRFVDTDPTLTTSPEKSRYDWLPVGNA